MLKTITQLTLFHVQKSIYISFFPYCCASARIPVIVCTFMKLRSLTQTQHAVGLPQTSDHALRTLSDNTKHSQGTDIHAVGGILSCYSQYIVVTGAT